MPRRSGSTVPRRSTAPALKPGLAHHNLPEPYASLQSAGWDEALDIYLKIGDMAGADEAHEIVERLTAMALDSTYYEYGDPASEKTRDPRTYAPLQAIRALCYVPEDAARVMKRLIPLFDTEDDALREELPFLFAAMGYQAYDELVAVTLDSKANIAYRDGAAESLVEMVEDIPDLEPQVVKVLERALAGCKDSELAGYLVLDLMDLGNETSLTVIEQAFEDGRVDEEIATLEQAKEHFAGLAEPADSTEAAEEGGDRNDLEIIDRTDDTDLIGEIQDTIGAAAYENAPAQQPYVAGPTPGRNDPCPCGSGKKYKKCCG